MPDDFYREKSWELLMNEIKGIKETQNSMAKDIEVIKNQKMFLVGIVATVSFIVSFTWQWIIAKVTSTLHQ